LTAHQVGPGSNNADETGVTGDELSLLSPAVRFWAPLALALEAPGMANH